VCTELGCRYLFCTKIFWKQIRTILSFEYDWHETAIFTKYRHVILTSENRLKYSAWQLSFAFSYEWCYIEKIWKAWWYPTMDDLAHGILSSNVNKPLHWIDIYNSENWCVRSGYLCQGVHRRWWSEETFNILRNKRSSNHIVTKTDPMELSKQHTHSNCSTPIPVMLCYISWIRNVTCQCLFYREELG
jgi:hypothetical protein